MSETENTHVFYANFVNKHGEEAQISGSPTITVSHFEGQTPVVDIDRQPMFLIEGGVYAYSWALPKVDTTKSYSIVYKAHYDDSDVIGCEDFLLYERGVSKKISTLTKEICNLETDIRTERLSLILSELNDLHSEFEDFKKAFILSLPNETRQKLVECLKNEDERTFA